MTTATITRSPFAAALTSVCPRCSLDRAVALAETDRFDSRGRWLGQHFANLIESCKRNCAADGGWPA